MTAGPGLMRALGGLEAVRRAVAVVAHPDDESFGLGAVLAALVDQGAEVSVVCLTRGEASTLGAEDDLGVRRDAELQAAAHVLGVSRVTLCQYPDGHLAEMDPAGLDAVVEEGLEGADLVVAFEPGGVTGHPDHRAATTAAERVAARHAIPLLEWGVDIEVAAILREELGAPFVGLTLDEGIVDVDVDRRRQFAAIACHPSQAEGNAVLARRLALQGGVERLVWRPALVAGR